MSSLVWRGIGEWAMNVYYFQPSANDVVYTRTIAQKSAPKRNEGADLRIRFCPSDQLRYEIVWKTTSDISPLIHTTHTRFQ